MTKLCRQAVCTFDMHVWLLQDGHGVVLVASVASSYASDVHLH